MPELEKHDIAGRKSAIQPVKAGTQAVLIIGFGGLLAMMMLAGMDSISVLLQIRERNVEIRQNFLARNRALEQIRAGLYVSGTSARDFLLERDPVKAEAFRASLLAARNDMDAAVEAYTRSLAPEPAGSFRALADEIHSYWMALEPILHWNAQEKLARSESFTYQELFPRRATTLQIADRIAAVNERELNAGNEQLEEIFNRFRARLIVVLAVTMTLGIVLSAGSTMYLARLARDAESRFRAIMTAQGELKELSARLVETQEKERRALSRELHDEVGQSLSAVLMEIGNLNAVLPADNPELRSHLDSIRKLADNSVKVVRNMALLLRPSMLDDLGLVPALQWQAREISRRTGMEVEVTADNVADDLPEDHKTCIYRLVQEALHNCAQHSGARTAGIVVVQEPRRILVTVKDDGKGFDSARVRGMGLLGMEERAAHLGGTFQVTSKPGQGTVLKVELPLVQTGAIRASA